MILDWFALIVLLFVSFTVYWNSRDGEFVFDDLLILEHTRFTKHTHSGADWQGLKELWKAKRGLLFWTFRRDAFLHGYTTRGWHYTNMAIHAVNVVLVYAILRWVFSIESSYVGAMVFAVHPLCTASVSSISGRSSSLCATFYFGVMLAVLLNLWLLVPALMYVGLRAKEEIVLAPIAAVLWRYWA